MRAYTDETYYINDYLKGRKPVITAGFLFLRTFCQPGH